MADFNRGARLPGTVPSPDDVRALLRACNRGATGARNRALLAVLWRGGLRTAEALALRPSDLNAARGLVRVRRGKGGRPRTVGMDPEAFALVDAWAERRRQLGLDGHSALFCTLQGRQLDSGYVRAMLARLARRAGLQGRVHLHGLRHACAVGMLREGATLPEVQAQLGHSSLKVTSRYLSHVTPDDLATRARQRPAWSDAA